MDLAKPNEVGPPVETGPIVVTPGVGTGFGIAIGIDHKVENIFSNVCGDPRIRQRPRFRFRRASAINDRMARGRRFKWD
jgi:hypothetical protein